MTQEFFEVVKRMDITAADTQIVLRCAPFIAGLKISNLLVVQSDQTKRVKELLQDTRLAWYLLYEGEERAVILLYRCGPLLRYLTQPLVRQMLLQSGYREFGLEELLLVFAARYRAYVYDGTEFPHEMGLFLGYPLEDVRGFIENGGKGFLYAGYWKVYQNESEKIRLFHIFDKAGEKFAELIAQGICIKDLLKYA